MGRKKNNYIFMEQKKRRRAPGCLILLLAVIFAIVALSVISNGLLNKQVALNTEKVRIMGMNSGYENVTILHISDLHGSEIGFETEKWKDLLFGEGFTAVVMTGDMVGASGDYAPMISLIRTLRDIKADVPIYFIAGDEDPEAVISTLHGSPEPLAEWVRAAQAEGAIYLDRIVGQTVGKKNRVVYPREPVFHRFDGRFGHQRHGEYANTAKRSDGGKRQAIRSRRRRKLPRALLPAGSI